MFPGMVPHPGWILGGAKKWSGREIGEDYIMAEKGSWEGAINIEGGDN